MRAQGLWAEGPPGVSGRREKLAHRAAFSLGRKCFLDPARRIYAILWPPGGVCGTQERKPFSYNNRTIDRTMGPFLPLWHFLKSLFYEHHPNDPWLKNRFGTGLPAAFGLTQKASPPRRRGMHREKRTRPNRSLISVCQPTRNCFSTTRRARSSAGW
jgi:hypothetical protein